MNPEIEWGLEHIPRPTQQIINRWQDAVAKEARKKAEKEQAMKEREHKVRTVDEQPACHKCGSPRWTNAGWDHSAACQDYKVSEEDMEYVRQSLAEVQP